MGNLLVVADATSRSFAQGCNNTTDCDHGFESGLVAAAAAPGQNKVSVTLRSDIAVDSKIVLTTDVGSDWTWDCTATTDDGARYCKSTVYFNDWNTNVKVEFPDGKPFKFNNFALRVDPARGHVVTINSQRLNDKSPAVGGVHSSDNSYSWVQFGKGFYTSFNFDWHINDCWAVASCITKHIGVN